MCCVAKIEFTRFVYSLFIDFSIFISSFNFLQITSRILFVVKVDLQDVYKVDKNKIKFFIFEELKTSLMSIAILFHFLCAQHVSDVNISIVRSLRLCCWITTSVVLFSVRCVLCVGDLVLLVLGGVRFAGWSLLQPAKRTPLKTSRTKSPSHNELRTRRPMW